MTSVRSLLIFLVLFAAPAWASGATCADAYSDIINHNARIKAVYYTRPNARDVEHYGRLLGQEFLDRHAQLGPGRHWIDSGAGWGMAGLETALKSGARVNVINAQDFWAQFDEGVPRHLLENFAQRLKISLKGLPASVKKRGDSVIGKFTYYDFSNLTVHERDIVQERILDVVNGAIRKEKFRYNVGFAEHVLPQIDEKADLITDVYGAFFYSAGRMRLLDDYYEQLKPGGAAMIKFRDHGNTGVRDSIEGARGRREDFAQFLVSRFPRVFKISSDEPGTLIMSKDPGVRNLRLRDLFRAKETQMNPYADTQVPEVIWERAK